MKKNITRLLAAALLAGPLQTMAQETEKERTVQGKPVHVSDKGYWVAEGNVNARCSHIFYFYNNNHVLVYQEKLEGARLNFKRRKTLMKMKAVLESSVDKWEATQTASVNQKLVAASLGISKQ